MLLFTCEWWRVELHHQRTLQLRVLAKEGNEEDAHLVGRVGAQTFKLVGRHGAVYQRCPREHLPVYLTVSVHTREKSDSNVKTS